MSRGSSSSSACETDPQTRLHVSEGAACLRDVADAAAMDSFGVEMVM